MSNQPPRGRRFIFFVSLDAVPSLPHGRCVDKLKNWGLIGGWVARINVEDSLFKDARFFDLVVALGSKTMALGACVEAWIVAQRFWKLAKNGIPRSEWVTQKLNDALISAGLADDRGDFIYVRGSAAHFAWLHKNVESGKIGGIESGKARREIIKKKSKRNEAKASETNPLPLSLSPSPIQIQRKYSKGEIAASPVSAHADPPAKVDGKKLESRAKAQRFAGAYVRAYQTRYPGGRPEDLNDPKVRGQILSWVSDYPIERAEQLIQVYFQMEAKWFNAKGYDFITFRNNLNKIGQALDSGEDPDGQQINWKAFWEKYDESKRV